MAVDTRDECPANCDGELAAALHEQIGKLPRHHRAATGLLAVVAIAAGTAFVARHEPEAAQEPEQPKTSRLPQVHINEFLPPLPAGAARGSARCNWPTEGR